MRRISLHDRRGRGDGTRSIRDRAILALGLGSALRRSELVALDLADCELVKEGARLTIRIPRPIRKVRGR